MGTDFGKYSLGITVIQGKCELDLTVWGDESVREAGKLTIRQLCLLLAGRTRKRRIPQ